MFIVHDPASHCPDEWAELDAIGVESAIIAYLNSTGVHPGENPIPFPVLVREHGGDWQTFEVKGAMSDDGQGAWFWRVIGRWTGRRVPPPEEQ